VDPYGLDYGGRLQAVQPPGYNRWGEVLNAGAGYTNGQPGPDSDGPQQVMNDWLSSPGHRQIIMSPNFSYAGMGIYYFPGDAFRCYWGMLFAGEPKDDPFSHDYIDPEEVL
jgi:uncharacterized protein YkwD